MIFMLFFILFNKINSLDKMISKRSNLNDVLTKEEVEELQSTVDDSFNAFMRAMQE